MEPYEPRLHFCIEPGCDRALPGSVKSSYCRKHRASDRHQDVKTISCASCPATFEYDGHRKGPPPKRCPDCQRDIDRAYMRQYMRSRREASREPKKCVDCGCTFPHRRRSTRCKECGDIHAREQNRLYQQSKRDRLRGNRPRYSRDKELEPKEPPPPKKYVPKTYPDIRVVHGVSQYTGDDFPHGKCKECEWPLDDDEHIVCAGCKQVRTMLKHRKKPIVTKTGKHLQPTRTPHPESWTLIAPIPKERKFKPTENWMSSIHIGDRPDEQ